MGRIYFKTFINEKHIHPKTYRPHHGKLHNRRWSQVRTKPCDDVRLFVRDSKEISNKIQNQSIQGFGAMDRNKLRYESK